MIVHCRLDNWWIFFFSGWLDAWWWLVYWRLPTLLIGYICLILLWKKIGWQAKVTEVFQITSDIPAANHRIPVLIFEVDSVNVILTALNYSIMFRDILGCSDHETQQLYKLFATFPPPVKLSPDRKRGSFRVTRCWTMKLASHVTPILMENI